MRRETRGLPGVDGDAAGSALFAGIEGPRGLIQLFAVMLDYPLDATARRQQQVRQLCQFVAEVTSAGT